MGVGNSEGINFYDVEDPSAYVWGWINDFQRPKLHRGPIVMSIDEREELHAEGMAIICKLARDYVPQMEGYDQEGCFSGYAAWAGPKKLGDAWHRLHENHRLITQSDGKRKWEYKDKAMSLEAITEEDGDRASLMADRRTEQADLKTRLHQALFERWTQRVKVIVRVGEILSEGGTPADCAHILGITADQVRDAIEEIRPVISKLQSEGS